MDSPLISVNQLGFCYEGNNAKTLDQLTFSIQPGEVFGLLGPSGSGKSTTQQILMGLLNGFSGQASIFNQDADNLNRSFYERIGVSFELPTLYLRLTALENLRLFAALYSVKTLNPMEVLAMVGLETDADKRVEAFSKGMKMRLNLCRALLNDPELLFLDEPTTGQDPARARITRQLIQQLKQQGKTIFLTTHNMAEADEVCDRVGFLVNGRADVIGQPAELKRRYGQRTLEVITISENHRQSAHHFNMDNIGEDPAFLQLLKQQQVLSMHSQEASLDDVFIRVAGQPE